MCAEKESLPHQTDLLPSRIPHGFYEHQMRAYFSQFGTINRLRLARNRQTGAPKHYGFMEFESREVADIVARTMDKYLLYGHILQVRLMPPEQVHEKLFNGANKRFKRIPWNAMERRALAVARERDVWQRRIKREQERRETAKEKASEYGYEFEMPSLKQVEDVPESKKLVDGGTSNGSNGANGATAEATRPRTRSLSSKQKEKDVGVTVAKSKKKKAKN
jgi:nucleolar protein 15